MSASRLKNVGPDTGLFHEEFLRVRALRGDEGDEVGAGGEAFEVDEH